MLVLGIETSCDETSAAIVENGKRILSNIVLSSLHLHKPYGGVVPEIACRHHAELIDAVIQEAFLKAKRNIRDIGLIAVIDGPGLIGALLVGLSTAKGLAISNDIPLIAVNHIWAHLYAPLMDPEPFARPAPNGAGASLRFRASGKKIKFPFVGLVVSGGHTNLIFVKDFDKYQNLGQTTDDAVGEAFDKVAKILGLGYPGGPVIEQFARRGNPDAIRFPKSLLDGDSLDFSFSGIKTAVLYHTRRTRYEGRGMRDEGRIVHRPSSFVHRSERNELFDICASFQDSVIDVLIEKSIRACNKKKSKTLVVGGGVSINSRLRKRLSSECKRFNINVYFPREELCMDNAAMAAGLGYWLYKERS